MRKLNITTTHVLELVDMMAEKGICCADINQVLADWCDYSISDDEIEEMAEFENGEEYNAVVGRLREWRDLYCEKMTKAELEKEMVQAHHNVFSFAKRS